VHCKPLPAPQPALRQPSVVCTRHTQPLAHYIYNTLMVLAPLHAYFAASMLQPAGGCRQVAIATGASRQFLQPWRTFCT
jgi:hypothetical protein